MYTIKLSLDQTDQTKPFTTVNGGETSSTEQMTQIS